MFSDVKLKFEYWVRNDLSKNTRITKLDCDKFKLKYFKRRTFKTEQTVFENKKILSNATGHTFLKLLDIHGEILIKDFFKSLDSSVGRAKD